MLAFGIVSALVAIARANQRRNFMRNAQGVNPGSVSAHRLNSDQIQQVVYNYRYDPEKDNCMVCLDGNCDVVTLCGHYFHF